MVRFFIVSQAATSYFLSLLLSYFVPIRFKLKALTCLDNYLFSISRIEKLVLSLLILSFSIVLSIRSLFFSFLALRQFKNGSSKLETLNLINREEVFTPSYCLFKLESESLGCALVNAVKARQLVSPSLDSFTFSCSLSESPSVILNTLPTLFFLFAHYIEI